MNRIRKRRMVISMRIFSTFPTCPVEFCGQEIEIPPQKSRKIDFSNGHNFRTDANDDSFFYP